MEDINNPKILIVDDRPENLLSMEICFEHEPLEIIKASSGNEALSLLLIHDFAVVLLDVQMPEMDGFEVAELMRKNRKTSHIPIIFVTAISKEKKHIFKGYETGAVDYIFKPIEPDILKSKVSVFLQLYQNQKALEISNNKLRLTIDELESANNKIIEQQNALIEEERLKVLLEMAGATAHELNQPLMALLGSIELMVMNPDNPEKMDRNISVIKASGERIASIVNKIQTIRHAETKPYVGDARIINLDQPVNILYIEDSIDDYNRIKDFLSREEHISLLHASTIQKGLSLIRQKDRHRIDVIFMDFILEDGTGFELLEQLGADNLQIPIVVITGQSDASVSARLIQSGACDYLTKAGLSAESVSRAISNALEKSRLTKDLVRMQARLVETATRDTLTGLYNSRYFRESLTTEFERANRYETNLSLLMIDIDHFKSINDTYGHQTGDKVLSDVAKIFSRCTRKSDIICRYGGEEFTIIVPETDEEGARVTGEKIRLMIEGKEFITSNAQLRVTVSIGVATNENIKTEEDLLKAADEAMYRAKNSGRNQVQ